MITRMTNAHPVTLVLGASENPSRYSNMAISRLVSKGFSVLAVGLRAGRTHGVPIYTAIPNGAEVDTVTLYIGPVNQHPWIDPLIALAPRRVIFNPGTENPETSTRLEAAGIMCESACTLVLLGMDVY
jgi:predicted CoA-binding protein